MAVAHDASSMYPTGTGTTASVGSFSWTHTPVGTPKGVIVFEVSTVAVWSAVTYGGVSLTAVPGGSAVDTSTEPGAVVAWFLGSGIPTGAQTIEVTRTNNGTASYAYAATVTAGADTGTAGVVLLQANQVYAEQSVDDGSPGADSVRYATCYSGLPDPPPAGANSTSIESKDTVANGSRFVRETTAGQGARSVGCTHATSDDVAAVHLAIIETGGAVAKAFAFLRSFPRAILNF